jgi:hypothetical protein
MKKLFITVLAIALFTNPAKSDEGMWIPLFLGELNEAEMAAMGMRITAEDIYSENHSSLKDAIVIFGGGCTAEVISGEGLILTNHHCGFGRIQSHSSLEHDYLTNGFWAMDKSEELTNPGLKVTFLIRMEEVTEQVLEGVELNMNESDRSAKIEENIIKIKEDAVKDTRYNALVKSFFCQNRYFLFINEVFEDVRLVGAPPSSIGKFGGDTDNWMWPRHTGDFSLFRIYADSANNPAKYSVHNIPYKPKKHLTISTRGVKQDDFTFIFGYPGSTTEYIPSFGVDLQVNYINPVRIALQGKRIDIYKQAMNDSPEIRIQYAAKLAGIANGWKKSIGENRGIMRLKTIDKKEAFELEFQEWAGTSEERRLKYRTLLDEFKKIYNELSPVYRNSIFLGESVFGIELIKYARTYRDMVNASKDKNAGVEKIQALASDLKKASDTFYKNYQVAVDKDVFIALMTALFSDKDQSELPAVLTRLYNNCDQDVEKMCEKIYSRSVFTSKEKLIPLLDNYKRPDYKILEKDIAFKIAVETGIFANSRYVSVISANSLKLDSLMRIYMAAQIEMQPMKNFYPDANFTLRISYGNVSGFNPSDAVAYNYFTTLEGIMEKEDPDIFDYVVDEKLKELYLNKDYGNYADQDGTMHVCFTATNHTSGGNSGSPVLDADGNLIGLNFDRCWEGTMSDIDYDISQCRNIGLDIRYCLFIIDKFAGAGHLIDEMTIVAD